MEASSNNSPLSDSVARLCERFSHDDYRGCHLAPTHWNDSELNTIFPFPENYHWRSLAKRLEEIGAKSALFCITPLVWQLQPLAYASARKVSVPTISIQTKNLSLVNVYSKEAPADMIVTAPEFVTPIIELLERSGLETPCRMLVLHQNFSTLGTIPPHENWSFTHELHLVPGFWLLSQPVDSSEFEINEGLAWKFNEGNASIELQLRDRSIESLKLPYRVTQAEGEGSLYNVYEN